MGCYLVTRTILRKGRYETTHEAGSLARVLSEARALVASAKATRPEVRIDKRAGEEPLSVGLILRTARASQVVAVFHATLEPDEASLSPGARQAADPDNTEAVLRDFILGA